MSGFLGSCSCFFYVDIKRPAIYGNPVFFHGLSSRQRQRGLTDCSYGGCLHATLAVGNGGSNWWNDTPTAAIAPSTAAAELSSRLVKSDRNAGMSSSSTAANAAPATTANSSSVTSCPCKSI